MKGEGEVQVSAFKPLKQETQSCIAFYLNESIFLNTGFLFRCFDKAVNSAGKIFLVLTDFLEKINI